MRLTIIILFISLNCFGQWGKKSDSENGLNCWDLNSNGVCDLLTEDSNLDNVCDALDCQGQDGVDGADGANGIDGTNGVDGQDGVDGTNGIHCWDLNGNGVNDANEDSNSDGSFNALDCIVNAADTATVDVSTNEGYLIVEITNSNGVVSKDSVFLPDCSGRYLDVSSVNADCDVNGSFLANPVGFNFPYTLFQYRKENEAPISFSGQGFNLECGTYHVLVVDEDGCTASQSITIQNKCQPTLLCLDSVIVESPFYCARYYANTATWVETKGAANAQIVITATGTYDVQFNNPHPNGADYKITLTPYVTGVDDIPAYPNNDVTATGFTFVTGSQDNGGGPGNPQNIDVTVQIDYCRTTCAEYVINDPDCEMNANGLNTHSQSAAFNYFGSATGGQTPYTFFIVSPFGDVSTTVDFSEFNTLLGEWTWYAVDDLGCYSNVINVNVGL